MMFLIEKREDVVVDPQSLGVGFFAAKIQHFNPLIIGSSGTHNADDIKYVREVLRPEEVKNAILASVRRKEMINIADWERDIKQAIAKGSRTVIGHRRLQL